jgi:DNA adenine methylase
MFWRHPVRPHDSHYSPYGHANIDFSWFDKRHTPESLCRSPLSLFENLAVLTPIKWAGGKRWLLPTLLTIFPKTHNWYFEPFAGGASAFFGYSPNRAYLADLNAELITSYIAMRDYPEDVWQKLRVHSRRHSERYYYEVRTSAPRSPTSVAARFLYLNRTCWNGLFRVNKHGAFNVPRGTKDAVLLPVDRPLEISKALRNAHLICSDFEMVVDCASRGDLIYADPPYTVKHNYNGFLKYNESIFNWSDQERLAASLRRARRRGAHVVVSNADHQSVRELYERDFKITKISRHSIISGNAEFRCATSELLITGGI